jgi:hypothetical protein
MSAAAVTALVSTEVRAMDLPPPRPDAVAWGGERPLAASACRLLLLAASALGCGAARAAADEAHLAAMALEHARDTPTPNASAQSPRQEVRAEEVSYGEHAGTALRGYLARPAAAATSPLPALLVIHEWWGLNDNVRMMTRRLAGEGYVALAVDLYRGRTGDTPNAARTLNHVQLGKWCFRNETQAGQGRAAKLY